MDSHRTIVNFEPLHETLIWWNLTATRVEFVWEDENEERLFIFLLDQTTQNGSTCATMDLVGYVFRLDHFQLEDYEQVVRNQVEITSRAIMENSVLYASRVKLIHADESNYLCSTEVSKIVFDSCMPELQDSALNHIVGENAEHALINDEQTTIVSHSPGSAMNNECIHDSNRPTPQIIVSSRTVVDIDGNPLHSTNITNTVQFPVSSPYSHLPTTNAPRGRRGRPSSLVASSYVRRYVGQIGEHTPVSDRETTIASHSSGPTLNDEYIPNSNRPTPMMIVSSRTVVDNDGNPLHLASLTNIDCGDANHTCVHCQAMVWYKERNIKTYSPANPNFSICCNQGKVTLLFFQCPPQPLRGLLDYNGEQRSKVFRQNIKLLNAMFSFTSTGGKINTSINDGRGPYTFRLNGHNHHKIGTLLPTHDDGRPRFAQLYIYDIDNEIDNRFYALHKGVPSTSDEIILRSLVQDLIVMLDQNNALVQAFRMAKERFNASSMQPVTLRLIVAALIRGDSNPTDSRDVLIEERGSGSIKRISELHPISVTFSVWRRWVPSKYTSKYHYRTIREEKKMLVSGNTIAFVCINNEGKTLHKAGHLFHTYVVDAYTAVLDHDLDWYKRNQKKTRSDLYNGLHDHICTRETSCESIGRWVILPSSFTSGPRHMIQQYQDAMAICRWDETPDLFITMTSNPRWPKIERHQTILGQPTCDRPNIIARVFKVKLDELMKDIRKKYHFGRVKAVIYTIEFQKRGLPHCHALVFLHPDDKSYHLNQMTLCSFEAVRTHMIHGPCGQVNPSSPCMYNGRCSKGYPKKYCDETFIRRDGWPCYRRSNKGAKVQVGCHDIMLDNRFGVPYNRDLLVKYGCHINVEWCNQGMLVKYLFSYLNKGPDRATVLLEGQNSITLFSSLLRHDDEIEEYIKCRYISASEACWKLFAFDMHYRSIGVERLPFHEEGCNRVYFRDNDQLEYVVQRATSRMSKFTGWMEANRVFLEGRSLTYVEFPNRFTWHEDVKLWMPRKNGFAIGRIYYVSPKRETYYLRMLLNVVQGPLSFKDIRTVDGVEHSTYMSACKALSLLGDATEWSESIRDACLWQFGNQVRELFVTILLFCMVNDHAKFFPECFPYLSEDVVYNQRRLFQNEDVLFSDDEVLNCTLIELEKVLNRNNRSLADFPNLPQVNHLVMTIGRSRLIAGERAMFMKRERGLMIYIVV
ncbi:LOW QUALITY PROTEIN: hypothetical protein OSB04_023461 [Centaurea solstitialis]|uniref:Helitron helicase-like domain-containing protein n=1 Tax=Centaurea solstitialis TaxID=347529 RepID=A0AA38WB38_9ASTR|nr:LOW QUALITY PROTEIN: hypothetical protein OSB04_023461 [Centaurea solstitialis]